MRRFLAVLVVATGLSLFWAVPSPAPAAVDGPDGQVQGVTDLPLPDGTHLAVHLSRAEHPTAPPLIIVHGGPGVADMADDVPAFAPLATHRDVYVYDRIGTGASTRLDDPAGYTTERDVSDLETLRASIGADRVVLHGHSWGARIVTAYAQEHPNRVAALVLSAPGDLPLGGDRLIGDLRTRLDPREQANLYLHLARPRNLFTYALTAADPRVAHTLADDPEMDARLAEIYRASTPALFCNPALASQVGTSGVGYYAQYLPQLTNPPTGERVDLARLNALPAPVLIIKPACDYLPWSTAGYRRAFPRSRLVMIPDAGHLAYLERHTLYVSILDSFLENKPRPLTPIDGDTIPTTYRGTR